MHQSIDNLPGKTVTSMVKKPILCNVTMRNIDGHNNTSADVEFTSQRTSSPKKPSRAKAFKEAFFFSCTKGFKTDNILLKIYSYPRLLIELELSTRSPKLFFYIFPQSQIRWKI